MKKNTKMQYGTTVTPFPIIYTKPIVFIPKYFGWEEEAEKAELFIYEKKIICNLGTKLLLETADGYKEISIPFEKTQNGYSYNLLRLLRDNGIRYAKASGHYCDGAEYTQESSAEEALYCKNGMITHCSSPYWGEQYEVRIVNESLKPYVNGKPIGIIRFNNCNLEKQNLIDKWFSSFLKKRKEIDAYAIEKKVRQFTTGNMLVCSLFYKKADGKYEWAWFQ